LAEQVLASLQNMQSEWSKANEWSESARVFPGDKWEFHFVLVLQTTFFSMSAEKEEVEEDLTPPTVLTPPEMNH
jgi:hypothetical protein